MKYPSDDNVKNLQMIRVLNVRMDTHTYIYIINLLAVGWKARPGISNVDIALIKIEQTAICERWRDRNKMHGARESTTTKHEKIMTTSLDERNERERQKEAKNEWKTRRYY